MVAGRVNTRARRACVSLSITGSVLVMGAVVLAVVTPALGAPHSLPDASAIAWLLFAGGLVCGGIMIAVSGSAPGRARPARQARRGARKPAPAQPQAGPAGGGPAQPER